MPMYLYKCRTCGKEFNYEQKITDDSFTKCPKEVCTAECKGEGDVYRKISKNVGLVFNGSGFYLTDYKNKKSAVPNSERHSHSETETESKVSTEQIKPEPKTDSANAA